ncbi:RelA/SpoT domain-containing protein [Candidatus Saccharibacteria bacterium]|nr:MAG: RelA/SpoT domain-containing protein [Candidatus Saccharibacteria bacterium]
MAFPPVPDYSKTTANRAGRALASGKLTGKDYRDAAEIVNAWRICHAYPLNTFNATLRKKTTKYRGAIVAQRLKRLPTIIDKLQRQPNMDLTRMQDIGGVRAIVNNLNELAELRHDYEEKGRFSHELFDVDDYIGSPKQDGYRGVHLIYKYNNSLARNSKGNPSQYKGLFIEVQLRTLLQHEWATAVEAVSVMLGQHLKTQRGNRSWLEFFEYMSSIFAIIEKSPVLNKHKNLTTQQITDQAAQAISDLHVIDALGGWKRAAQLIDTHHVDKHYNLIVLNTKDKTVRVRPYTRNNLVAASKEYSRLEEEALINPDLDIVLVAAGGIKELKKAYPNYFLDIENFIEKVKDVVKVSRREV